MLVRITQHIHPGPSNGENYCTKGNTRFGSYFSHSYISGDKAPVLFITIKRVISSVPGEHYATINEPPFVTILFYKHY